MIGGYYGLGTFIHFTADLKFKQEVGFVILFRQTLEVIKTNTQTEVFCRNLPRNAYQLFAFILINVAEWLIVKWCGAFRYTIALESVELKVERSFQLTLHFDLYLITLRLFFSTSAPITLWILMQNFRVEKSDYDDWFNEVFWNRMIFCSKEPYCSFFSNSEGLFCTPLIKLRYAVSLGKPEFIINWSTPATSD